MKSSTVPRITPKLHTPSEKKTKSKKLPRPTDEERVFLIFQKKTFKKTNYQSSFFFFLFSSSLNIAYFKDK